MTISVPVILSNFCKQCNEMGDLFNTGCRQPDLQGLVPWNYSMLGNIICKALRLTQLFPRVVSQILKKWNPLTDHAPVLISHQKQPRVPFLPEYNQSQPLPFYSLLNNNVASRFSLCQINHLFIWLENNALPFFHLLLPSWHNGLNNKNRTFFSIFIVWSPGHADANMGNALGFVSES